MEEQIIGFFAEKLSLPREEIKNDTVLIDMGVDSMTLLSLLLELEDKFGVKIDDREIENLVTVGDLVRLVSEKKR